MFIFNKNAYFSPKASYVLSDMIVLSLSRQQTFTAMRDEKNNVIGRIALLRRSTSSGNLEGKEFYKNKTLIKGLKD